MIEQELLDLKQRVADLERRMMYLDGGGPRPGDARTDPEVQQLIAGGKKIQAIKRYRELTGVGLAEAKDAVDAIERGI